MLFSEIIKMALASLGANKLRAALTMIGITIGVFSVISVMTAIGALQSSIESGISFLGSNIFQFAKYPANVNVGGEIKKKYQNRPNVTYREALHYAKLMEGHAREICLKSFGYEVKGQAVYNGVKTTPSLLIVGTNRSFLAANAYTLGYGRNLNDEDVELSRRAIVVGKMIEKRLFPHETPIGKVVRVSGHTLHDRRCACGERHLFRPEPGRCLHHADHPIFRGLRRSQAHRQHCDTSLLHGDLQSDAGQRDKRYAHCAWITRRPGK